MIEFNNITKKFGNQIALSGLTIRIEENSIFGFIGPTGSGKTTAMKILCGLLTANTGSLMVDEVDVIKHPQKIRALIGYVPDMMGIYENLKVKEYMNFYACTYNIESNRREGKVNEIIEMLGLSAYADEFIEDLSRNKKKKLSIGRALINDPRILLLDEPFSGLSMKMKEEFIEVLKQLNSLGMTIIITAHTLKEVAGLCGSVAAFEEGRAVIAGSISEIEKKLQYNNPIMINVKRGQDLAIKVLKEEESVNNIIILEDNEILVYFDGTLDEEGELLKKIILEGAFVTSFSRKGREIEMIY